ncbi:DNA-3-methyladenine glycosylase [Bacillus sp. B15-48]|uniref:DNA-3-methyladenine glycosylase family protein n=1 Tax=Bacillus sp. B15-48 TaxID=1548601 RepID=UPI00193EF7C1|nr:DNA-3-methyladenine glycosylase [Bacillus sp. B15-48]MBM4764432.1 DNA-3-methyladenine glycosylase 2 family protein [Bacillus sp. B15-48]
MWQETIAINGPYHFERALERLALDPLHSVDIENKQVKVPISNVMNQPIIAEVEGNGNLEEPLFIVRGTGEKEKTLSRLHEIFAWNTHIDKVHEHFQTTDLKALFQEHYGTPLVLDFDPFGCLLKCIIHQQLNLAFAYKLSERFVKEFGTERDGVWFYPTPEKVASLNVEQLREMQFSGRKAEYIIGLGEIVASGKVDIAEMKKMSDEEITARLIKIRGIGPWTVQNFLMFGLGRLNLFPMADIGLQNALKKYYQLEEKPSQEMMGKLKQPWEPYLSYASLYLWRSIE